eukprot:532935-Rhodomonas_salina.1
MVGLDAEERLAGLYAVGVEAYRVKGTSRRLLSTAWSHIEGDLFTSSVVSILDEAGCVLVRIVGFKAGAMEARAQQSLWSDGW